MTLQMRFYADPVLRKQCALIKEITPEIREYAEALLKTMDVHNGIGLASNQVGKLLRIFVVRKEKTLPNGEFALGDPKFYINPKLSNPSEETEVMMEGCLSFPGLHVEVERPLKITVEYMNLEGELLVEEVSGYDARVIMHENDHLNGTLFIDRCSKEERKRIEPLLKQLKKKYKHTYHK